MLAQGQTPDDSLLGELEAARDGRRAVRGARDRRRASSPRTIEEAVLEGLREAIAI